MLWVIPRFLQETRICPVGISSFLFLKNQDVISQVQRDGMPSMGFFALLRYLPHPKL